METDLIDRALAEDVGDGDATTEATVDASARGVATITQKAPGVISGLEVAEAVFRRLDPDAEITRLVQEGEWREGGPVLRVEGSARGILTAERTALNFLGDAHARDDPGRFLRDRGDAAGRGVDGGFSGRVAVADVLGARAIDEVRLHARPF